MAHNDFESRGPFVPHALVVARNKAVDALRRGEARRGDRSLEASSGPDDGDEESSSLRDELPGSRGADVDYFRGLDQAAALQRLALAEEAIYASDVLSRVERQVFVSVRVDGKSRAAVGRELDPPLTGQRVGQITARALIKVQAYVRERERGQPSGLGEGEGGRASGRD
ncbi:MAG: hypothetical protein ACRDHO_16245 [Actinomycetota bacterium]